MRDHEQRGWAPAVIGHAGESDVDVYVVGIRDTDASGSWSLLFMECCDTENPPEVNPGMDTYCLVVDPGQATCYSGVRECELGCLAGDWSGC